MKPHLWLYEETLGNIKGNYGIESKPQKEAVISDCDLKQITFARGRGRKKEEKKRKMMMRKRKGGGG